MTTEEIQLPTSDNPLEEALSIARRVRKLRGLDDLPDGPVLDQMLAEARDHIAATPETSRALGEAAKGRVVWLPSHPPPFGPFRDRDFSRAIVSAGYDLGLPFVGGTVWYSLGHIPEQRVQHGLEKAKARNGGRDTFAYPLGIRVLLDDALDSVTEREHILDETITAIYELAEGGGRNVRNLHSGLGSKEEWEEYKKQNIPSEVIAERAREVAGTDFGGHPIEWFARAFVPMRAETFRCGLPLGFDGWFLFPTEHNPIMVSVYPPEDPSMGGLWEPGAPRRWLDIPPQSPLMPFRALLPIAVNAYLLACMIPEGSPEHTRYKEQIIAEVEAKLP